jgi:hypothetical protein
MKQTKRFKKALRGLEGVIVWVHDVDQQAAEDGLSRQHLQDEITVRILDSGVKALGIGNVPEPPGNPWLNIFINTQKNADLYSYFVSVRLDETVRPERNRSVKTIGTTWEAAASGSASIPDLPDAVERAVDDLVDYFVYDYWLENHQAGKTTGE